MSPDLIDERDVAFNLYDVLEVEALLSRPRFADHSRETFDTVLQTAADMAAEFFAPHYAKTDASEPYIADGQVVLVPEAKTALDKFSRAGFLAAHQDYDVGGMQLPWVVAQACAAHFAAANLPTYAYAFLTAAAANLLKAYGSEEQQRLYMQPMLQGRYYGTMALTETQAGSSLADIRTRAQPTANGHYLLRGSKMFISGGEHELGDNIIHLVLARIAGSPAGVKGISLFIVPRYRTGRAGETVDNDVSLAGLNHKMGYRGTVNTVLSFGESDDCHGWLVGEPNRGMEYMFHMMNEARIVVGMTAAALGLAGLRHSLTYARDRRQGRPVRSKDPAQPPCRLIEHVDVRRMLLAQKAFAEGAFGLGLYLAKLVDDGRTAPAEADRRDAGLLLDLLTPIMKAWSSDYCLVANSHAIQILGGYGYTREFPVEQLYRDNRLNPIHEGTNGIQAIDLLGRKVASADGAALRLMIQEMTKTIGAAASLAPLAPYAEQLLHAIAMVEEVTSMLLQARKEQGQEVFLANASAYLDLLGRVVIAWVWLRQGVAAFRPGTNADADFRAGKLQACRYFYAHELPAIAQRAALLTSIDTTSLAMQDEWF